MRVLDLFSGMGGFSLGFAQEGFEVIGVDIDPHACRAYRANVGHCIRADLRREAVYHHADVVLAGPPCRPWSVLNQARRRSMHPDYPLPMAVIHHVAAIRPRVVVMENVPPRIQQTLEVIE